MASSPLSARQVDVLINMAKGAGLKREAKSRRFYIAQGLGDSIVKPKEYVHRKSVLGLIKRKLVKPIVGFPESTLVLTPRGSAIGQHLLEQFVAKREEAEGGHVELPGTVKKPPVAHDDPCPEDDPDCHDREAEPPED